ncbi:MAG TPA: ATP-binding protein, partial [Thermoanaerobaculia bacterium]
ALQQSLGDQKKLHALDPEHVQVYRGRFEQVRKMLGRMAVLDMSRREMAWRYELSLVAVFAVSLLAAGIVTAVRARRDNLRLAGLQSALQALSLGDSGVRVADRRRDVIGRIGRMVEETSRLVAGQRRQIDYLDHLSAWQEAARRHAHEIRGPLTAARLEIDRLISSSSRGMSDTELERIRLSVCEELERLSRFTREFSSFAAAGNPRLRRESLPALVGDLRETFLQAWPNLTLQPTSGGESIPPVLADRDLLRQVLLNLCTNSSQAIEEMGTVSFRISHDHEHGYLDVGDDGPGISAVVLSRLFEPYVTTRRVGEGMGLGLAISRKILLDHGGDLELLGSSSSGTTFRLALLLAGGEP